jgi:hypothetical protein
MFFLCRLPLEQPVDVGTQRQVFVLEFDVLFLQFQGFVLQWQDRLFEFLAGSQPS